MKRARKWTGVMAGVLLVGIGVAAFRYGQPATAAARVAPGVFPDNDAISHFLMRHWANPLPPQGPPPKNYSPLEASLAPASCGQCHRQQYEDWRTSVHSHSIGPGILWQFRIMTQAQANKCMRCHTPLAEQKALAALEYRWPNAPPSAPPAYVGAGLFHSGLVCAACHVRHHHRFGPPPPQGMPAGNTPGLPHDGFTASKAFFDSRFCAVCHQFPPTGRGLNGKLFENTYQEWRASKFAAAGTACQSCHMPKRRHLWRGIHDPAMVRQGLDIRLTVQRKSSTSAVARAVIHSKAVGHDFPTYLVPKVYVSLYALDHDGSHPRVLARKTIGRTVNLALTDEVADTRIPPGGSSVLTAQFATPADGRGEIALHIEVAPEEHYERLFRHELAQEGKYDFTTIAGLRKALARATATRYRLTQLTVPIPPRTGQSIRKVAN